MNKGLILGLLLAVGILATQTAAAQSTYNISPPGGMTIKNVVLRKDGWGFVTFVESFPEIANCTGRTYGSVAYMGALWIDMTSGGPTGKQIYASALSAWMLGKKLEGVTFVQNFNPGDCDLQVIRLVQ